jgi:hypothetical protein
MIARYAKTRRSFGVPRRKRRHRPAQQCKLSFVMLNQIVHA